MARQGDHGGRYGRNRRKSRRSRRALGHHFVAEENIPSLKGCKKAGFEPYLRRADRWRMFRHASTFGPLPPPLTDVYHSSGRLLGLHRVDTFGALRYRTQAPK